VGQPTPGDYAALTPLIWERVNPYGRFDLEMDTRSFSEFEDAVISDGLLRNACYKAPAALRFGDIIVVLKYYSGSEIDSPALPREEYGGCHQSLAYHSPEENRIDRAGRVSTFASAATRVRLG
jgi:hypothetical protein